MANDTTTKSIVNKGAEKTKKKSKNPLWQKILLGVVLFIVALIVIAYVATSGPAKVSDAFLKDIQTQQADAAYSLFSKEAQGVTDKDTFQETVKRIGPLLNTKAKQTARQVEDSTGSAALAQVTYEIKGTDGVDYKITIQLVKQDDQWKVNSFDSSKK